MNTDARRRFAGLALATACALAATGWATAERVSDGPGRAPERIASVRWPRHTTSSTSTTRAPATTTTESPATTVPAPAPTTTVPATTTTKAPATTTTQAPAPTTTVAPTGGWGNLGQSGQQQMLAMVNAKRTSGTTCGGTAYPRVPALSLNTTIIKASDAYATDMATHSYFGHTGRDGSDPGQRLTAAGYRWSAWAENIAAGQTTPDSVVAGWFGSTGHCVNFMSSAVTQIGFGKAENPSSVYRYFWVADLGRPA
jgi:uncharacterized protein YkwD